MNKLLFLFAVGVCFALGQTLECYKCKLGFWDVCITSKTTCSSGEHCFSGLGTAAGFVDIKMKGCLAVDSCNKTQSENLNVGGNVTLYKITKTCCNSDLCNGAPGLPGGSGLSLAAAIMSALITAKVLV
ncbi:sperm acrosome membrane-associated protein 4 [Oryzias melastigma]|uniref:Lymphocyte antigen-6, epidermis n=1 Tax=Oryzias melastigma TaxID=30732 RepID=A0A3B3D9C0_ORYME|nr:sperm acrosome membrane-associated protein 4 [Oryzias melastigma]